MRGARGSGKGTGIAGSHRRASATDASALELAKRLISIPSPFGEEEGIAEFVASKLAGDATLQRVEGAGPNVVARSGGEGPRILLCGHMDTVPPPQGYESDPYKPFVRDGKLYGLGSADMKAGLACAIELYNAFSREAGIDLTFLGTSDEEGDCRGVFRYLRGKPRHDLAIVFEPTGGKCILGARGRYVVEIIVKGRAWHGARPDEGANAIDEAAKAIAALGKLSVRRHRLLGGGSKCILKIEGGGDSLSVPDRCVIRLDRHVVPGDSKESVMRAVGALMSKAKLAGGYDLRWMRRPTPFLEPYATERTDYVRRFLHVTHKDVDYAKSVGDYNALGAAMPTIVYGPNGSNWHALGENVEIGSLKKILYAVSTFLSRSR